ncbi:Bacteriochlorophyllide c C-7(1)-hydroxylase [subsurface metagenome]|nr:MSMEG_0568 family radical SAM protein [Methanosarcinales archaeon]
MAMETKDLKVDLLCLGARVSGVDKGRKGGAGPAAGGMFLFGGTVANVPTQSWFVSQSPYNVDAENGKYVIKRDGERISEVHFPSKKFEKLKTGEGIPYNKIALLHGADCLATTTIQTCVYWNTPKRCKFCAIELSLKSSATIARKKPEQLAEVALAAKKLDHVTHVTLTTGTTSTPDRGINYLAETARAIKEATGLSIHAQFEPPEELSMIDVLYDAVDTVGIHVETFDRKVLEEVALCKAEIPFQQYIEAWKRSVKIFGDCQVSSYVIAGMGESDESIIEGSKVLAELGVYPFIVPLRPIPGSDMENEKPPSPNRMRYIYEEVAGILHDNGVSWRKNKAGCVRCRACSALADFE